MKTIIVQDTKLPQFKDEAKARTGLVLFKNENRVDSIKFIDNLSMPDAISLVTNAVLFLMKTYEKLGADKQLIYEQFNMSIDKAFEMYMPEYYTSISDATTETLIKQQTEAIINKMKEERPNKPKPENLPKGVLDPYES